MTEGAKNWNASLYPELETGGGLPAALQTVLGANSSGLIADGLDSPGLAFTTVRRWQRLSQVMIATNHRAFSVDFWHQGVQFGSGWTSSLTEAAGAIQLFLTTRASARILQASFAWVGIHEHAYVHEQGPSVFVEYTWQCHLRWLEKEPPQSHVGRLLPLVRACLARPRLRQLMPFTSHDRLCFSTTTGSPYTCECPASFPVGEQSFRIEATDSALGGFQGDADATSLELERLLARDCGAACHGSADDSPGMPPNQPPLGTAQESCIIHVALLDEGVAVWRPVHANRVQGDVFRIQTDQSYDREQERWQFEPGQHVVCELKTIAEGPTLVAVAAAPKQP